MNRTCLRCGRVAFSITRKRAEAAVRTFNEYYGRLSTSDREKYYGSTPASIALYERCMQCGNSYTNFREEREGDCPNGCTLSPIIYEEAHGH